MEKTFQGKTRLSLSVLVVIAIVVLAAFQLCALLRPDLSQPISYGDKLTFTDLEPVMVGEPLLGYLAPIENFTPVYTFKKVSGESIFNWVDESATRKYWLPLYDESGMLRIAMPFTRVSDEAFFSMGQQLGLLDRLSAERLIAAECEARGITINSFRHVNHAGGCMVLADTSGGVMGVFFNPTPMGGLLIPFWTPPDYGFWENTGRVIDERELRSILSR